MKELDGIHHISAITADGPRNADFYVRVMGLRLVKKTVNQDDPTVYHLFYADEAASAGADLTFFEYPGVGRGRPGAGMIHSIALRVGSDGALGFWRRRLAAEGIEARREGGTLRFEDPEGLGLELVVDESGDPPLIAWHPEIPEDVALRGFAGVRAYHYRPQASRGFLEETLGFKPAVGDSYEVRGENRGSFYAYDQSEVRGVGGAGTVHHVAFATTLEDHEAWRLRVLEGGAAPTPVIDRFYFRSVYFREPGGVLFELATLGPGFATDEAPEHLGEALSLPPAFEHLRPQLQSILRPVPNPRLNWSVPARARR